MNWEPQTTLVLTTRRVARILVVTLISTSDGWIGGAVESSATVKTLDDVFDDHGHKSIGTFETLPDAIRAGERFAREWSKSGRIDKCSCKEILKRRGKK